MSSENIVYFKLLAVWQAARSSATRIVAAIIAARRRSEPRPAPPSFVKRPRHLIDFWEIRLFDRYDVEREFEQRRAYVAMLCVLPSREWLGWSELEIAAKIAALAAIQPLRLLYEEASFHDLGPCDAQFEGRPLFAYMTGIPFEGDDLWDLYVQKRDHVPQGEIKNRELRVYAFGHDEAEGRAGLATECEWIEQIVREQEPFIRSFNHRLKSVALDQLRKLSCRQNP